MRVYVANAFTNKVFSGNQAGIVIMDSDVLKADANWMQNVAKELKHSETAFIYRKSEEAFQIRYFTGEGEVPLCGHATIATFSMMSQESMITNGTYKLHTNEEILNIQVENGMVWIQMAKPEEMCELSKEMAASLYEAYELDFEKDKSLNMWPKIIKVGISDIILPVKNHEILLKAKQDANKVSEVSKKVGAAGVHMFCLSDDDDITAYCSNYAPLFGIEEECATGTASAGLTYYLFKYGLLNLDDSTENHFIQGEHMNRKCQIKSRIEKKDNDIEVFIGGQAVVMMECKVRF